MLDGLKTLVGIARMHALPPVLCSDVARMQLVGCKAHQVHQGIGQRGASTRQGERLPGPICPDTLANNIVKWHWRDLEAVCKGSLRALAQAGVVGATVTGMADGTDLETTARHTGCGQVTRTRHIVDTRGQVHEIEVTVSGGNVLLWSDAATQIPRAVPVGLSQARETPWTRALGTQARAHVAGAARLAKVIFDQGFGDGRDLWWLAPPGRCFVVPATAHMAVTADARAQAAAGEAITVGRRVHTVRHGQGKGARTARLETEVVGITELTSSDQDGTVEHAR